MRTNAGVWIDHREAVIVVLSETGETTTRIASGAEKHPTRLSPPSAGKFKGHRAPADDTRQNEFAGRLARYYDEVISSLSDAGAILIFGPGEAKEELHERFGMHANGARNLTVETTGKLTEPQIEANVRRHFMAESR